MTRLSENSCQTQQEFLEDSYCNLQEIIFSFDQAISALLTGTHQSYQLNTGQSEQRVTRLDLADLIKTRKELMSELSSLAARLGKVRSVVTITPGF